ncbi:MAG: DUF333 domain-containing protein [Archaeoglobales archaeon]|jgi:eight-cysteine-cluster-containing protein|nr:DUF333 domain-containing protein [Archaeoglobales archaeon]
MNRILIGLAILIVVISGISVLKHVYKAENKETIGNNAGVANPAAVYCKQMGYEYRIENTAKGQAGICVFPDKTECEEWAFFRGECGQKWAKVNFEVGNCSDLTRGYENYYVYDSLTKVLRAYVTVNCGSDEVLVERGEGVYRIIEKDYDGQLLRCLCQKEVKIFNATDIGVEFVGLSGEAKKLEKRSSEFCGWSTHASCKSDADCKVGGCSGQVCMGVSEDIATTCEWKDCYNPSGMKCGCVNNECQWIKI